MDAPTQLQAEQLEEPVRSFYLRAMAELDRCQVPYLVGGGYAMACYTGIHRQTKDLDLFLRQEDSQRALDVLCAAGYRTELTWPHFLVKVLHEQWFIDFLYNSGNGLCPVDEEWFQNAAEGRLWGRRVPLCPPEEMIWSKSFVQARDRYDGADIAHLILHRCERFDWDRLMRRFAGHEEVLLSHLVLFGYVYPSERSRVPEWVADELWAASRARPPASRPVCQGTFLAPEQYRADIRDGYLDARLDPLGPLTAEAIARMAPAPA